MIKPILIAQVAGHHLHGVNTPTGCLIVNNKGQMTFLDGLAAAADERGATTLVEIGVAMKQAQEKKKREVVSSPHSFECPMCKGAGCVTSDTGQPWPDFVKDMKENDRSAAAYRDGDVTAVECEGCGGAGKVPPSRLRKMKAGVPL